MFASTQKKPSTNNYGRRFSTYQNTKRSNLDQENSLMAKPISEQNEWIRNELKKYFGEDEADYFVNPTRTVSTSKELNKSGDASQKAAAATTTQSTISKRTKAISHNTTGLYAQKIWDGLRDDSGDRLKPFDLDKELQDTMDKFLRNGIREQNEAAMSLSKNNPEMDKLKQVADMTRIKKARKYRNEIELMYRSSKLNEEKVNVLRSNSPLPDLNDVEGTRSIVQYLPPINLKTITHRDRADSRLDFVTSISQQIKLRNKLKEMTRRSQEDEKEQDSELSLVELRPLDTKAGSQFRYGDQIIQLRYLDERPYTDYLSLNRTSTTNKLDDTATLEAEYLSTVRQNDATTNRLGEIAEETSNMNDSKSLVLYDENAIVRYPPLSMNALMEYKPALIAPGSGAFKGGRVKLYESK